MSIKDFRQARNGACFFYSERLRIDRLRNEGSELMSENSGAFGMGPAKPLTDWLVEAAKDRAEEKNLSFATALGQIKFENPQIANASRMEVTGVPDGAAGGSYLKLMRRALEIMKATGLPTEACLARAEVENPELAMAARKERGGSIYAGDLAVAPGIGDAGVLLSDGVDAALDPSGHLNMLAEQRCRERGVSFVEALVSVGRERPWLVRAAREQTTGRKLH